MNLNQDQRSQVPLLTSIFLIDDHPMLTNAVGIWLETTGRFKIAGTAVSLSEADKMMKKLDPLPEIVILDISMGNENEAGVHEDGLTFIPVLKNICKKRKTPVPKVLVCSMYDDPFLVQRAMDLGANAFVSKSAVAGEMMTAIDAILAGGTYTSVKNETQEQNKLFLALTKRENDIVSLVKQSLSNEEIAKMFGVNNRTVEKHLEGIYEKTGVSSRKELFEL
jgi:DNA-binding NarL/FixJ family response regulator